MSTRIKYRAQGKASMGKNDSLRASALSAEQKQVKALLDRHERAMKRLGLKTCPLCNGGVLDLSLPCVLCHGNGWVKK